MSVAKLFFHYLTEILEKYAALAEENLNAHHMNQLVEQNCLVELFQGFSPSEEVFSNQVIIMTHIFQYKKLFSQ